MKSMLCNANFGMPKLLCSTQLSDAVLCTAYSVSIVYQCAAQRYNTILICLFVCVCVLLFDTIHIGVRCRRRCHRLPLVLGQRRTNINCVLISLLFLYENFIFFVRYSDGQMNNWVIPVILMRLRLKHAIADANREIEWKRAKTIVRMSFICR